MHYTGSIFRPPFEARSLLLQVTAGCSHNSCSFCSMYRDTPFRVSPMEEVLADLREAKQRFPGTQRIFLEGGDAFALSTDRLLRIADACRETFPLLETITCYASVLNVHDKSAADLKRLRDAGINEPNFGIESGLDHMLRIMNKGFTVDEARAALAKLRSAGMDYSVNLILGAEGGGAFEASAEASAAFVNETKPFLVFAGTLHYAPGSPLYEAVTSGRFRENTVRQLLLEEIALVERLDVKDLIFLGIHTSNPVPAAGILPNDRERLLKTLRAGLSSLPEEMLDRPPRRGEEGAVLG